MHALSGCDTVSFFAGHGKKSWWSLWAQFPQITDALISFIESPTDLQERDVNIAL